MGTFDQNGNYVPRKITERDASFAEEIESTFPPIKEGPVSYTHLTLPTKA